MPIIPIDEMIKRERESSQQATTTQEVTTQQPVSESVIPIDQVIQQQQAQPSAPLFTPANLPDVNTGLSPLSFNQNLMLSFAPNDETRMAYLRDQFKGSNIKIDPEQGILINGLPVNPKGFDFGDIPRSTGYIFPFLGQILGSLGAGALAAPSGPGMIAAGIGGGIGGATIGEGVRLAVGDMLGLDTDGKEVWDSLSQEAKYAAVGEAVGLGMTGAGRLLGSSLKTMGRTRAIKGLADIWRKSMARAGESAPALAQFIGAVNPNATRIAQKHGFAKTLTEKYFDPQKSSKIVRNLLFGNENADILETFLKGSTVQKGTTLLAKSIKEIGESSYDDVIKIFSGLSDDTIKTIKMSNLDELFSPNNLTPDRAFTLAKEFSDAIVSKTRELGRNLSRVELEAIRSATGGMRVGDIAQTIDKIIGSEQVLRGIKVPGFYKTQPIDTRGIQAIRKIRNLFGSVVSQGPERGKFKFFNVISPRQARKIRADFDIIADEVFANKNIPGQIKRVVKDAAEIFRTRYYNKLGLSNAATAYRMFKGELEELAINPDRMRVLETVFKKYGSQPASVRMPLEIVFENLPNGEALRKSISLMNAGDELSKLDILKVAKGLEGRLTSESLLDVTQDKTEEIMLRNLNNIFKNSSNPLLQARSFMDDAEMSLAAKGFTGGSPNILRVGTIASMLGLGGIGFRTGGPIGGIAGLVTALSITNPRGVAKLLVALDKAGQRRALQPFIENAMKGKNKELFRTTTALTPERKKALLKAMTTRVLRGRAEIGQRQAQNP